jgi:hypothetical protein
MKLDEAIQHCEEVADTPCFTDEEARCYSEHRQLAEWLKELKAYKDARAEIAEAFNDDVRNDQNDYERGRKSGIFLCESIISVKLGESRSEIPNTCGDAISRQAVLDCQHFIYDETGEELEVILAENVLNLPSVTPQQRTGRWIQKEETDEAEPFIIWECDNCHKYQRKQTEYCPKCGSRMMEVEE